jgi:hypothetical protein
MENHRDLSELFNWYQHFANIRQQDQGPSTVFNALIQEYANYTTSHRNLLQDCFPQPGSISVIQPSSQEPNLNILHRAITTSSNSTYALRYLFHPSVRKFYTNFSLDEVNCISARKMSKVTLMELLVVLNRMLTSQENNMDYPDIFDNDLPYRSRSWVLNLIQYLESEYIWRVCVTDEFRRLNNIVGDLLQYIDYYEITMQGNEIRFLNNLNV